MLSRGTTSLGSLTYAALVASYPASSWTNYTAFVTNWGANGTAVRSNGTRWIPSNGQTLLKRMGGPLSGVAGTETIVGQVFVPAGLLQAGDTVRFIASHSKSGTTDNCQVSIRVGTAGTTSDTAVASTWQTLTTTQTSAGVLAAIRIVSNTSAQRLGQAGSGSPFGGSNATAVPAAVTISDASSNGLWITYTVKSNSTTDTCGVQEMSIIHEAG